MPTIEVYRAFLGGLGTTELVLILVIIMILFGVGKLPQVGEALGKALKNFKGANTSESTENQSSPTDSDKD